MGRPEKAIDPLDGPVQRLAYELRKLREETGSPAYRAMARRAGFSAAALSKAAAGERPPSLPVLLAYVRACGGDEEEWQQRWERVNEEIVAQPRPAEEDGEPPYRGLARFEPGDAELFFGRDEMTGQLEEMARRHRVSAVVGASGSGKSSLLRAGLIPRLRRPDQEATQIPAAVRVLTPGAHPMGHADRLKPADGPGDTWLLVDQFEELFTLCDEADERESFLDQLLAARKADSRLRVILAVRADFFGRCAEHHALAAALNDATLLVGPLNSEGLRAAIVRPAGTRGLQVEGELTDRILEEVADEPGALPLMSHALMETWRRRRGRTLTMQAYEAAGGLHGAIAHTAEDAYHQLTADQASLARHILLRLIAPGNGTEDTHRPTPRAEFTMVDDDTGADIDAVFDRLARARLLALDDGRVFLAHEKLITAWPRLHNWVNEERDRLRLHRQLTHDATTWHELDRDPGTLYRGTRLAQTEETFTGPSHEALNPLEAAYLRASVTARLRSARRRRIAVLAFALTTVFALLTAGIAVERADTSEELRRIAVSRELAGQAMDLAADQPEAALLTALAGYRQAGTEKARSALISTYAAYRGNRLGGHTGAVTTAAFAPDGRTFATAGEDHTIKLWGSSHRPLATLVGHVGTINSLAFALGGRLLVTASDDGTVRLWDLATHRAKATLTGQKGAVGTVAVSPNGRMLATAGSDAAVRLWIVSSHGVKAEATLRQTGGAVNALAFSTDGRTLAAGGEDRKTRLWDVTARRQTATVTGHSDAVNTVAFSPDGQTLATSSDDGTAKLWTASGSRLKTTLAARAAATPALAFTPNSKTVVTAGPAGGVSVWDARSGRKTAQLPSGAGRVVALRPDGRTVAVVDADASATTKLWDLRTGKRIPAVLFPPGEGGFSGIALRPGSAAVAAVGYGKVSTWDTRRGRYIGSFPLNDAPLAQGFSPDGRVFATSADSKAKLWSYPDGKHLATLDSRHTTVTDLDVSPDGRTLATAGYDGTVRLWNLTTRRTRAVLTGHSDSVQAVAFSPDGTTLASAGDDRTVRLWDVATGRRKATLTGHTSPLFALDFSPDGKTLAAAGVGRTIRLWNVTTHGTTATFTNYAPEVTSLHFSPDGKSLATAGRDRAIHLWNVATHRTTATLTNYSSQVPNDPSSPSPDLVFAPGGHTLISTADSTIRLWDLNPDHIAASVCRQSKADHWEKLLRALPTEPSCP